VVTLSVDPSWEKLRGFFGNEPYFQGRTPAFHVLLDKAKLTPPRYGTFKYPETYLVGRRGELLARFVGPRDWQSEAAFRLIEELR
jgi:hypothetical protein